MITALGINPEDATAGDNKIIAEEKLLKIEKNEDKSRTMEERRL